MTPAEVSQVFTVAVGAVSPIMPVALAWVLGVEAVAFALAGVVRAWR